MDYERALALSTSETSGGTMGILLGLWCVVTPRSIR